MTALDTAKAFYRDVAKETEGRSAQELAERLRRKAERISDARSDMRDDVEEVLRGEDRREVMRHLEEARQSVAKAFEGSQATNKALPEGMAGQAFQGQSGSETFDARAIEGQENVVDAAWAEGVAAHEHHHTEQQHTDVASVRLQDGMEITEHDLAEAGAIEAQEKAAPRSIDRLSEEYKGIRRKMRSLLPSAKILELSKSGKLSALPVYAQGA
ncbi:MAG: hypothetical protein WCS85_03090 [Candidatus Peribacteraceae bacterium]